MRPAQAARSSTRSQSAPARVNGRSAAPRALVAEGDGLARNALRQALTDAGLCVVGQAADTPQLINLARRCHPDVIVMDVGLPPDGGVAAVGAVLRASSEAQVVLLGVSGEDDAGLVALERGAAGYLSRDTELASLGRAVVRVADGEAAVSRSMGRRLIERLQSWSNRSSGLRPIKSPLTPREWEVLELMMARASTAEMAQNLVLAPETVQSHVNHILRKLDAHSRAEAIEIAEHERMSPNGMSPNGSSERRI
jgi:two-component system, NarL family, response regulator LiaR